MSESLELNERQKHNYLVARALIGVGCPVFPCKSNTKRPLIPGWQYIDAGMDPDRREKIRADFVKDNGFEPAFIGATRSPTRLKKFVREFPDAIYGIPCGLTGVLIVDADEKHDGPKLLAEFVKTNGGWPEGTVCIPTQGGGEHHYFVNDTSLGNSAGEMKALGCDIKGEGGLCIAPASWREDGKRYGSFDDLSRFVNAYYKKTIPAVPGFVKAAIGQQPERKASLSSAEESKVIARLEHEDWPEYEDLFQGPVALYDLSALEADRYFRSATDDPSDRCSENRWKFAHALMREWPSMPPEHLAVFYGDHDDCGDLASDQSVKGTYTMRCIAREWLKHAPTAEEKAVVAELKKGETDADAEELGADFAVELYLRYLEETTVSDNTVAAHRLRFLQMLRAMLADLSATEGLTILRYADESGLNVGGSVALDKFARDWARAKNSKFNPGLPSDGSGFGTVEEEV